MSEQDISLAPPDHSQELTSAEKEARAKELDAALSDLKEATSLANENVALRTQLANATRKLEKVKAAFYVNMLKCYPDKSHAEIQEAIDQAIEQGKGGYES